MANGGPGLTGAAGTPTTTGAVGTPSATSGPLQLEKAWHGLMYAMAFNGVAGAKTVNSTARHLRRLMRGAQG